MKKLILMIAMVFVAACGSTFSQTTEFTYQGHLQNSGTPANGNYDFEFALFDAGGGLISTTITRSNVAVANGIFSVKLDFGSLFPGANRLLEIRVRQSGGGAFTTLAPRQPVSSTPYAIKSLEAVNATNATQLGGVAASQYVTTTGGGANFIQNTTSQQSGSNFNVSGTGTASVINATTHYSINGNRVFSNAGQGNLFAGRDAGTSNTSGFTNSFFGAQSGRFTTSGGANSFFGFAAGESTATSFNNSFFGTASGQLNTTGENNSFFGAYSGLVNTGGISNSFFGASAGTANTGGSFNSFFGESAGLSNTTGVLNAFFGQNAGRANTEGNNNSFFGRSAGVSNITGNSNAFFGIGAGGFNTSGNRNAFFGDTSAFSNTTGSDNAFFGYHAGQTNGIGSFNTFIGENADPASGALTNATAIGANAEVSQSNSLVLGSINGTNGATADTNVGIGTTAPAFKLEILDQSNTGLRVGTAAPGGTVASFGGNGAFRIDAPFNPGGRFQVAETGEISFGTLAVGGGTPLCRNALFQISSCSSLARDDAVQEQQRQLDAQQKQIEQQRNQIEELTKIVCGNEPKGRYVPTITR